MAGIAAANAFGITVTAALLLTGLRASRRGSPHGVRLRVRPVLTELSRPVLAAVVATAAGAFASSRFASPVVGLAAGVLSVAGVFAALSLALGVQGSASAVRSVRTVTRRLTHGRSH